MSMMFTAEQHARLRALIVQAACIAERAPTCWTLILGAACRGWPLIGWPV
jgi:hypothetical protein